MLKFVVVQATKLQQYSNTLHWFTVKVLSGPNAAEPQLPVGTPVCFKAVWPLAIVYDENWSLRDLYGSAKLNLNLTNRQKLKNCCTSLFQRSGFFEQPERSVIVWPKL